MIKRLFIILVFLSVTTSSFACTDFQIKTTDGNVIIGRSMEFAIELDSEVLVYPRGESVTSTAPGGKEGLSWRSKYGFIAVTMFGKEGINDGMNEEGLSFGYLWFGEAKYNKVAKDEISKALGITYLGSWILGNFSTVDEVKEAIKKVRVFEETFPTLDMIPPLHVALHDAKGKSIVIEFIDGETVIYDNPLGVLTNSPSFDWHITNLRNYVNITAFDSKPITIGGMTIKSTGQGSGLIGMPGDWTSPSRFVRAVMFVNLADPVDKAEDGINLAEHILNTVDIPLGDIKDASSKELKEGYTQWVVVKDLKDKIFYFRTYRNLSLRGIDMKKLNLNQGSKTRSIPLNTEDNGVIDITDRLL